MHSTENKEWEVGEEEEGEAIKTDPKLLFWFFYQI